MDPARWQQVKDLFAAALDEPATEVAAFLDRACGSDAEVRAEVQRLLREHARAGDFLERPVFEPPDVETTIAPDPGTSVFETGFPGPDRFEVRRKLGSGGFGDVYEVFDRQRKSPAALKYLRHFQPDQLYRLKHEFRTLSDIRHPNLVEVYELFSSHHPPFFTMELLSGQDLGECLVGGATAAPAARLRLQPRLLGYLQQLCHALMALHDANLVHRDIKPSNVFITSDERVVLLDLGLVKHLGGEEATMASELAGTPHYLSPEQIRNDRLTPASDWYAVGVLLYRVLTGRLPFDGSVADILADKVTREARPPREVARGVSPDLDALCEALLQRAPERRPGAAEVLRAIRHVTRESDAGHPRAETARMSRAFVGRYRELEALRHAVSEIERGATVCVHVRGSSGVGKSTLVRRFLEEIRATKLDCVILAGRCYETEAAPHKGLDELVDHLGRFLKRLDADQVGPLLPRYFRLLTRLFPVLQDLRPAARPEPDVPDLQEQRQRAFAALRECFSRISETYPLILWIDDLQWGDSDTARFLNDVVHAADPFSCLLVLSYRDSELDTSPVLRGLQAPPPAGRGHASLQVMHLRNLEFQEARALAEMLVADRGSSDLRAPAEQIARESKGNPYFISELVRYASAVAGPGDLTAAAFGIAHVIKRRVGALPESAVRLVELIAVAGQPLPVEVCAQALGSASEALQVRTTLIREHLIRTHISDTGEKLNLYHDQIRVAILEHLSPEAAAVYHGLLAEALETLGAADYERLAVHFDAAGQPEKALEYSRRAAADAMQALDFDRAARMYQRLLDATPVGAARQPLFERLGAAFSSAGRGREAAEAFLRASEHVDTLHGLELRRRACEQYLRSGHLDEGMRLCRQLLHDVGISFPKRLWARIVLLLWHRLQLRRLVGTVRLRPEGALPDEQKLRLDVCWTATLGMSMVDVLRGAEFQARYAVMALSAGERSRVALGLASELVMGSTSGKRPPRETDRLFREASAVAGATRDPHARGFVTFARGAVSWLEGDWIGCYERNQAAAAIYREECSGVIWELTTANAFALSALVMLGRWREHAARLPDLVQEAEGRGDRYGAVSLPLLAYAYIDHLANDQPARARSSIRDALSEWPEGVYLQHCDALIGETDTALYEGNPARAKELLDRHWTRLERSRLFEVQLNRILFAALRAKTNVALARDRSPGHIELLRAAALIARRLARLGPRWAAALAHLLTAGVASVERRPDAAITALRSAAELFSELRMDHYLAATLLRLSEMDPQAEDAAAGARRWMNEQNVLEPSRVADMLAPGEWRR